ncbi:MAG: hypothetical protein Q7V14_03990 [Coriobacteriia bacterium]|nr:hypothetical protein [Coriobacteriia bacterium]
MLLVGCGLAAAALVFWVGGTGFFGPGGLGIDEFWPGMDSAGWTAEGSRAVLQSFDGQGTPIVLAIGSGGGDMQTANGYLVVAIEPTGSTLWLVKADADAVMDAQNGDVTLDMMSAHTSDMPAEDLYRWDLGAQDSAPIRIDKPVWSDLEGPDGGVASFGVDPAKGSNPARLELLSGGVKSQVALPGNLDTYAVIGWSPSGTYFAVQELTRLDEGGSGFSFDASFDSPERRLFIIEARTKEVVFDESVLTNSYDAPVWDPKQDMIYYVDQGTWDEQSEVEPEARLMIARPDGKSQEAFAALKHEKPSPWSNAFSMALLGSDEDGVLVSIDTESNSSLWLVGLDGIENTGSASISYGASWNKSAGLLAVESESDPDFTTETSVLVRYDIHGGSRKELWRGEPVDIGGF